MGPNSRPGPTTSLGAVQYSTVVYRHVALVARRAVTWGPLTFGIVVCLMQATQAHCAGHSWRTRNKGSPPNSLDHRAIPAPEIILVVQDGMMEQASLRPAYQILV